MKKYLWLICIPFFVAAQKIPSPEQDIRASKIAWITFQAERGDLDSSYAFGLLSLLGEGVTQNTSIALERLNFAAINGHQNAIELLADLYFENDYVERDWLKSASLYESLNTRSDRVNFRLGYIYSAADKVGLDCLKAIEYFSQVDDISAKGNVVWLLATCPQDNLRDGQRAVELGLENIAQVGSDPVHLDNLAAAYAEVGDFQQAQKLMLIAISVSESQQPDMLDELNQRLEQYQQGQPYRQPQ